MTCRCKAQFCYLCGLKWRTCDCRDDQIEHVHAHAAARRLERQNRLTAEQAATAQEAERAARAAAREADLAAENQEILAEVEAFIRQESEKEARAAEVEWVRQEEEHIARVHQRFQTLNKELEILHDVQRILMSERYEQEAKLFERELLAALKALSVRHSTEDKFLERETRQKITAAEACFESEYQIRRAQEKRAEDGYVAQLEAFWAGKEDAEYQIRSAREKLRSERVKESRLWEGNARARIRALRDMESKKMMELLAKQRLDRIAAEAAARADVGQWRCRREAEMRWVDEVFPVRSAMLASLEVEEYAGQLR